MNEFAHTRMMLGFVVSFCIAQLMRGLSRLIAHPTRSRPYVVHLLWVFYIFLDIVFFWWWEYRLSQVSHWTFPLYLLVMLYIVLYCLLCSLLFPEDIQEYQGYKGYYYARRQWFFGLLAITYPVDALDTYVKGGAHMASLNIGPDYFVRTGLYALLCLIAARVSNERYHALLAILLIGDTLAWILKYNQLI